MRVTIYNAIVKSLLQYDITSWGGTYKSILGKLKIKHTYLLICTTNLGKYHTAELYAELNMLNLNKLYIV